MSKHILIADDDSENADLLVRAIHKLCPDEFTAEAVYDGLQCIERIKTGKPIDLILLDLDMPKANGADVIRHVLGQEKKPSFRILVTTAWSDEWLTHWNLDAAARVPLFHEIVVEGRQEKLGATVKDRIDRIREIFRVSNQ
jgi:CheY-like chemotaxis protein